MASGPTPSAEPMMTGSVTPTGMDARGEHGSSYTPAVSEVRQSTGALPHQQLSEPQGCNVTVAPLMHLCQCGRARVSCVETPQVVQACSARCVAAWAPSSPERSEASAPRTGRRVRAS